MDNVQKTNNGILGEVFASGSLHIFSSISEGKKNSIMKE
jgi:hypothetical protein